VQFSEIDYVKSFAGAVSCFVAGLVIWFRGRYIFQQKTSLTVASNGGFCLLAIPNIVGMRTLAAATHHRISSQFGRCVYINVQFHVLFSARY
jgi:hypothetical protein